MFPVGLGGGYAPPARVYDMALDRGINFFFYGPICPTYRTMARWISSRTPAQRERILIATTSYLWKVPGSLDRSVSRHLRWLGTDRLDFVFLGWIRSQDERALEALARMKEKGIIRHLAFSAHDRRLAASLAAAWPVEAIMVRYNIAHRGAETELFPSLSGADRPGVIAFNSQKHGAILRWARTTGDSLTASDLYRFVLSHSSVDMCLAGPRTVSQLEGLLSAVELGPLEEERHRRLCEIGDAMRGTGGPRRGRS